jgi:glycosyltransferase involved in cell wall biosynthesis
VPSKVTVSVIVPTHNRARLLREALDSIYAQEGAGDLFDLEVIVVDDGSTDNTAEIAALFPSVRYIRLSPNRGLSNARNVGIEASKGDYVAFLDDDDVWLPHKMYLQVTTLESHPEAAVAYGDYLVCGDDGRPVGKPGQTWGQGPSGRVFEKLLFEDNFIGISSVVVRRTAFDALGQFDQELAGSEDHDLCLRFAHRYPFIFTPGPLVVVRDSARGMLRTEIANGLSGPIHRQVIEKALNLLPHTAIYDGVRAEARIRAETTSLKHYARARFLQADAAWTYTLATLRRCPAVVNSPAARLYIAGMARKLTVASNAPIAKAQALCAELKEACSEDRVWNRSLSARRLLGAVWAEVFVGLLKRPRRLDRALLLALLHTIRSDPQQVARKGVTALWRRMRK